MIKIWIDITVPNMANFLTELLCRIDGEFDYFITAREHDITTSILKAKGFTYVTIGKHGGRGLAEKLLAHCERMQQLVPIVMKEKPDLLLTERDPSSIRTTYGLKVPVWAIFDDDRELEANRLTFPLAQKTFSPDFYTEKELQNQGVLGDVTFWHGWEQCYLKKKRAQRHFDARFPTILIRPEPESAAFYPEGYYKPILEETISILHKDTPNAKIVVFPRSPAQKERFLNLPVHFPSKPSAQSPIFDCDLVIGAAESLLVDAFVVGIPAIDCSHFRVSKAYREALRYIPHSESPKEIAQIVRKLLEYDGREEYARLSKEVIREMDDPLDIMKAELEKFGADVENHN